MPHGDCQSREGDYLFLETAISVIVNHSSAIESVYTVNFVHFTNGFCCRGDMVMKMLSVVELF